MLEDNKRIFWTAILNVKVKEILEILKRILENKKRYFPDKEIRVFGSLIKGKFTGGSDIDFLIGPFEEVLSQREISKIKSKLLEGIPWYYNIQIHVLDKYSRDFFERIEKKRLEEFIREI